MVVFWIRNSRNAVGGTGRAVLYPSLVFLCLGGKVKKNNNLIATFVKVPSWGKLAQIWPDCSRTPQNSIWDRTLPPASCAMSPAIAGWGMPAGYCLPREPHSALQQPVPSGMEVVSAGFAFGGPGVIGVKKMEMESLQETEGIEVERIRMIRAASSREHKCYLTRTWIDLFWNIVYSSDDPCPRKINWCKESLLVW